MKKVVVITGGTRGIGLGIGKAFFNEGYQVALIYRSDDANAQATLSKFKSDDVIAIKADITVKEARERLLSDVERAFGGFDVLVNNAAIIRDGRCLDISEENFEAVFHSNLHAPIFLSQLFAKALIVKEKPGSIINILSIGAYGAGNLAYCTSKAALLLATKCMAREFARYNIRANSISPFGVETELNRENRQKNPERWEKMLKKCPMGRTSTPAEVAGAAIYLASDSASYTTGTDILVDGGYLA